MNIKATDEWVEDLALQTMALRMALKDMLTATPHLRERIQYLAENTPAALLPTGYTEKQIARISALLHQLAELPKT